MPVLLVVGTLDLFALFATDKWLFYKFYRKPLQFDANIATLASSVPAPLILVPPLYLLTVESATLRVSHSKIGAFTCVVHAGLALRRCLPLGNGLLGLHP